MKKDNHPFDELGTRRGRSTARDQLKDLFANVTLPEPTVTPEQPKPGEREPAPLAPLDSVRDSSQGKSAWQQTLERWLAVPTDDPDLARKGRIFSGLLIASIAFTLAVTSLVGTMLLGGTSLPALPSLGIPIGSLIVSLISFGFLKSGRVRSSIWFYTAGIFIASLAAASVSPLSTGIPIYLLWSITVAGLLLDPIYAFWMALAATGGIILLFLLQQTSVYHTSIVLPQNQKTLLNLVNFLVIFNTVGLVMHRVLYNLNRTLRQERKLRVELIAQQNALSQQMIERTHSLQEANYQLQKRAIHLEGSAQVSRAAASILDPQELMQTTVDLIRNRFNYYHVSFFLLDETGEWAVVRASTGEVGRRMVAQPHRLAVGGESMVGWVCAHRQPRIALDVGADAVHFDHPWLPHTRSELTLPLLAGDRLLGALDVQSTEEAAFDDDDLRTLQGMADLIAIALENARLFAKTRRGARHQHLVAGITDRLQRTTNIADVLTLTLKDLGEIFDLAQATICLGSEAELRAAGNEAPEGSAPAYTYTDGESVTVTSLAAAWSPAIAQAVTEGQAQVGDGIQGEAEGAENGHASLLPAGSIVALPILLRDQVIGALQLCHKTGRTWQPDDLEALSEVTERLGLALETARLSEETRQRVTRERLIREISDQMQRATDLEALMRITAEELNKALGASHTYVRLGTDAEFSGGAKA
jgi:GAF domain-containing protein